MGNRNTQYTIKNAYLIAMPNLVSFWYTDLWSFIKWHLGSNLEIATDVSNR